MNTIPFPHYKLHDIAASLHQLAEQIERGELSPLHALVILEPTEGGQVDYKAFGPEPFTILQAVGLIECTKHVILAPDEEEEQ